MTPPTWYLVLTAVIGFVAGGLGGSVFTFVANRIVATKDRAKAEKRERNLRNIAALVECVRQLHTARRTLYDIEDAARTEYWAENNTLKKQADDHLIDRLLDPCFIELRTLAETTLLDFPQIQEQLRQFLDMQEIVDHGLSSQMGNLAAHHPRSAPNEDPDEAFVAAITKPNLKAQVEIQALRTTLLHTIKSLQSSEYGSNPSAKSSVHEAQDNTVGIRETLMAWDHCQTCCKWLPAARDPKHRWRNCPRCTRSNLLHLLVMVVFGTAVWGIWALAIATAHATFKFDAFFELIGLSFGVTGAWILLHDYSMGIMLASGAYRSLNEEEDDVSRLGRLNARKRYWGLFCLSLGFLTQGISLMLN